jgi:hypothetical protein
MSINDVVVIGSSVVTILSLVAMIILIGWNLIDSAVRDDHVDF